MDDQQILNRIDELVQEEESLLHRHEGEGRLTEEEHARLEELKVQLDRAWDFLRQRRSLRQYGIELIQLRLRGVVMREAGGALHLADDRVKRAIGVLG